MPGSFRFRIAAAAMLALGMAPAAHAEVYYWRDASGSLVLSDKPKDPSARTYEIAPADRPGVNGGWQPGRSFRTTRPIVSPRAAAFEGLIDEHATTHGVDANLVRAVIQAESAYNPRAVSVKGAMGLMQLMPATARHYGVDNPFDPAENIRAGVAYLKSLLVKFAGNLELALAAYNAGPGAVRKYGGTVPPYRETQTYVQKIRTAVDAKPAPARKVYKIVEYVNGRPVPRYSATPEPGAELVVAGGR
jgi:soluble lytic murein transglycosylase-like protein